MKALNLEIRLRPNIFPTARWPIEVTNWLDTEMGDGKVSLSF